MHVVMKDRNNKKTKKFPPLFWVAFIALIIFNLSVFIDYSKPLERYAKFAKTHHQVRIKAGSVFQQVERNGVVLAQCRVAVTGVIEWQQVTANHIWYVLKTDAATAPAESPVDCQPGDRVKADFSSDADANTLLLLLSIDFDAPFKVLVP
jgi:hypothetical protein